MEAYTRGVVFVDACIPIHCIRFFKRPMRDACLYMGGYLAPPAPRALQAPRFLFLITL